MKKYENNIASEMNLKEIDMGQDITGKLSIQLITHNLKHAVEKGIQTDKAEIVDAHCDSELKI